MCVHWETNLTAGCRQTPKWWLCNFPPPWVQVIWSWPFNFIPLLLATCWSKHTHTQSSLYLVSLQHTVYSVSRRSPAAPLRWFDYKPLQQKREANPDHFHLHGFRESLFCLSEFETAWLNFDSISWPDTAMLLSVLGTKHNKHTSGYKSP